MLLGYARTSTLDQAAADKASIPEQLARCKAIADMRGSSGKFDFSTFVDRGVSGSVPLHKRPQGKKLMDAADYGDIICASKLDRIFRSASDALDTVERLKRKGIGLIICDMGIDPVGSSPATSMFFGMLSLVAQFERERIHERITEGKIAKKARGGFLGGNVPYGYKKVGVGKQTMLVRCDKEQQHIARARELLADGSLSASQIGRKMADEGMIGRDGNPYSVMAVFRLVRPTRCYGDDLVKRSQGNQVSANG